MGQSASQAAIFYEEVAKNKAVFTIRDKGGFPVPMTAEGKRAQPFWSSLARVETIIKTVPVYKGFKPVKLPLQEFSERWVPGLAKDGFLVGVNWSGKNATGYDIEPSEVLKNIEYYLDFLRKNINNTDI